MSYKNQSDLYLEDNISKYPAIEFLCKLGFEYISPEECMSQRSTLYDVLLKDVLRKQLNTINQFEFGGIVYKFTADKVMNKLLELKNVGLTYQTLSDEITAIDSLSFNCQDGEFISIIGPSGCGKTTILSLIAGLLKPSKGKIYIDGKQIDAPNDSLGYMLQKDHLFNWRTIEKNIYLPLEIKGINTLENKEYALSLLKKYGLYEFRKNYPEQLSGGMRQRVALIRTLVSKPKILLLDEPFSALDYQTKLTVQEDIYRIIKNEQKTTILVTHDITEAIAMSDVVIVLSYRPAHIKEIIDIDFNDINRTPLSARNHPHFQAYFNKIWREIHDE